MFLINMVISLISSIVLIFTAFFVLFKNRGKQSPVYYFQYNISGSGLLFCMFLTYFLYDSPHLTQINRFTQAFTLFFAVSVFNLSLTFPEREVRTKFYIPLLCAIPGIIMALIVVLTDLSAVNVRFENMKLIRGTGPAYIFYGILASGYILAAMGLFIYNYVTIKIETYRLQIRYVILTTSVFIILAFIGSIWLPRAFGIYHFYVVDPAMVALVATVTLVYSIISINIMDIRTALHKTVMYATFSLTIFLPILAVFILRERGILKTHNVLIAGFVVLSFALFGLFLQPIIDQAFRKMTIDVQHIINTYIQKASRLKTMEDLVKTMSEELHNGLGLVRTVFFQYDYNRRLFVKSYDTDRTSLEDETIERNFPLIQWFTRNQEILPVNRIYTDDESFRSTRGAVESFFLKYDINAVLPLFYESRIYGMICLGIKQNMKSLTPDEVTQLDEFRLRANEFLVTSLAYDQAKKDQFISRSLELSSEILLNSAAPAVPEFKNMKFSSLLSPKYMSGTDYYDFIQPTQDTIGILCSDVSGVGINNALYSVIIRSVFHSCVNEASSPYIIMKRINLVLNEYTRGGGELATAMYAFYDSRTRRLSYTNAGFPPMELFRIDKNDFDSLDTEGSPLGYAQESEYGTGRTELKTGDICVIYSKSLINSKNSEGEAFGLLRLRNVIREYRSRMPAEIVKNLKATLEKFMGIEQPDSDVTALIIKIV